MLLASSVLTLLLFAQGFEPSAAQPTASIIRVCELELTELGRRARFEFTYFYSLQTGKSGEVVVVRKDERDHPPFVRDEGFEPCLRTWRLRPSSEYGVAIHITSNRQNSISIQGDGDLNLRLLVP